MITATKKSRTISTVATIKPLSGRGGVGESHHDTKRVFAARPKSKRTTGDVDAGTATTRAGRAKTKTRKSEPATETKRARRGGVPWGDTEYPTAATNKSRSDEKNDGNGPPSVAPAPSNGTADVVGVEADMQDVSRAPSKRRSREVGRATDSAHAVPAKTKRGRGVHENGHPTGLAASAQTNVHANDDVTPNPRMRGPAGGGEVGRDTEFAVASACLELQELQRQAVSAMKSRVMIENRTVATIATALGYRAGLDEKERDAHFDLSRSLLKAIRNGDDVAPEHQRAVNGVAPLIAQINLAFMGFETFEDGLHKAMANIAKTLPVAAWISEPDQRGIAVLSLARIIGETGDLSNYANPAKVWKRLGLAPYNGKMPSTWRSSKPGLSAEEWTNLGYSPRRRSVVYVIGECIVKANKGPYRKRYDDAKARFKVTHEGCKDGHAHNHGMLLASKEFIKQLWKQWNKA